MTNLPPIDPSLYWVEPRRPGESPPRVGTARSALRDLARYDGSHDYAYSWGYTIFRTFYGPGSDEAVDEALRRLAAYARVFAYDGTDAIPTPGHGGDPVDARAKDDFWRRYHCDLVRDEDTLAGMSESAVGERFDAWIREHRRPVVSGHYETPDGRFLFCLMFDRESVENILALPEDPESPLADVPWQKEEWRGWVKVISNRVKWVEEGESSSRWWLRVGVTDYLWPLWFMVFAGWGVCIEEMGWEAEDGVQNLWGSLGSWYE